MKSKSEKFQITIATRYEGWCWKFEFSRDIVIIHENARDIAFGYCFTTQFRVWRKGRRYYDFRFYYSSVLWRKQCPSPHVHTHPQEHNTTRLVRAYIIFKVILSIFKVFHFIIRYHSGLSFLQFRISTIRNMLYWLPFYRRSLRCRYQWDPPHPPPNKFVCMLYFR